MTVYPVTVHGRRRWMLDGVTAGVRVRRAFRSKLEADAEARLLASLSGVGAEVLLAMSHGARSGALAVLAEAEAAGVTLQQVWAHWRATGQPGKAVLLGDAIAELLAAKAAAGRAPGYLQKLRSPLLQFYKGREATPISAVTSAALAEWLDGFGLVARRTYQTHLSGLFRFAIRRGWMAANPCERLEPIRLVAKAPTIFTPEQAAVALGWLRTERPRVLGWFVLSCLCGLRPEEAERTAWASVDLGAGLVRVEAATSKMRQRRVVYPLPAAIAWLREAQRLGSDLPLASITRRRAIRDLRLALGWKRWPQDVTRHTAASYWLAEVEDAAAVAEQLGHDVGTMRRHYRALVTREAASAFWALQPGA